MDYKIESELSELLEDFKKGKPLHRPTCLLDAAEQVANQCQEEEPINIVEWAEKLSKILSKFSD